jgi:hypothetical protein
MKQLEHEQILLSGQIGQSSVDDGFLCAVIEVLTHGVVGEVEEVVEVVGVSEWKLEVASQKQNAHLSVQVHKGRDFEATLGVARCSSNERNNGGLCARRQNRCDLIRIWLRLQTHTVPTINNNYYL